MRTNFRAEQLADPHMQDAERALRTCVHCGFCTATCPTYVLLGDERDGPRGRIVLMQNMLEKGGAPTAETVKHLDQCLSCLGCRTACPSGVDYAALIDQSRSYIEKHYTRALSDRVFRSFILFVLTRPKLFAAMSTAARLFKPILSRLPGRLGAMSRKAAFPRHKHVDASADPPTRTASAARQRFDPRSSRGQALPTLGEVGPEISLPQRGEGLELAPDLIRRARGAVSRVLLLPGCVQRVLAPEIDAAAARVLTNQTLQVERMDRTGCCGALAYHLGKAEIGKNYGRDIIRAYELASTTSDVSAVLITASGCSAFLKDYPKVFADEPEWKARAQVFAAKVKDFTELARPAAMPSEEAKSAPVMAYHPPCSLQHGQRILGRGEALLRAAGYRLAPIPDAHLCCGSAGSYSLLQPEIAERLRANKLTAIRSTGAEMIASANIGCLTQLSGELPTVHIAELLDWAQGGPKPVEHG